MDDHGEVSERPVKQGRTWDDLLPYLGASAVLTVAPVLYILVTGAPWNGVAAVVAVTMGVTTLLLSFTTAGYYLLDEF